MEEMSVLIERSHAGDKEAREVLIEKNLGLVHHIVKRFLNRGVDAEDLFQIGCIGLMKAIDKFNLAFDVKFSTYAVPMISGEIKRFLRDDGMMKVSRGLKENGWKIKKAREQYQHEKGKEPALREVAEMTGLTVEEVVMAMDAGAEVESIYRSVYQSDGNEIYLADQIASGSNEKEKLLNHMLLSQLLSELEGEDKELILLRYFQGKTQVDVAERLGISQVQVSRLEKRILRRMRERAVL
ncbi:MAG: RNA polymerase sporulation sigma factor, SigF/SigG family [Lachnospiraceae bacterium]|jgi:RNA polymerase sporulation-specific sigma factor|nr:RNA polymerase sporulation sigma factor, SigF/SigG family [Lachnospiraceae bacterium]